MKSKQRSFINFYATCNRAAYEASLQAVTGQEHLHYISNNQECKDGELILMDFGAEYGGYNADLTQNGPCKWKIHQAAKNSI